MQTIADWHGVLRRALAPPKAERLSARITALLAHFFLTDIPANLRSLVITDWVNIFQDVPAWALDYAIERWLREQNKKPMPADILAMLPPELDSARRAVAAVEARYLPAPGHSLPA